MRKRAGAVAGGAHAVLVGQRMRQQHQVFRRVVDHQHRLRLDQAVQLFHCRLPRGPLLRPGSAQRKTAGREARPSGGPS